MKLAVVACVAAACGGAAPPPAARQPQQEPPTGPPQIDVACALALLPGRGGLAFAECRTEHHGGRAGVRCIELHVGVTRTAALYASSVECTAWLEPGDAAPLQVPLTSLPFGACGKQLAGCQLRVADRDGAVAAAVAFARELEAAAPHAGADGPTTTECEALRTHVLAIAPDLLPAALQDPDLFAYMCLRWSRGLHDCTLAAASRDEVERCAVRHRSR